MFKYYAFCLVLMMLLRPLLVKKIACGLGKSDRFKSIYAALYFFPILTVLQAVGGGLLCELSPDDANKHTDKHTLASDLGESANGRGIIFALRIRTLFKIIVRSVICKGCSLVALSLPYQALLVPLDCSFSKKGIGEGGEELIDFRGSSFHFLLR